MNLNDPSGRLMRWKLLSSDFCIEVVHKKGNKNKQADALSRLRTVRETVEDFEEEVQRFHE